jgi:Ca2+-binding RTX toxin-like protein
MSMLGDFDALSFAKAAVDRAGTSYNTTTITLGGDNIDAGAGNDIVFGDAGRIIMPQSSTLQSNGANLQAAALAFHAQLQDLQTVVADMAFVAHETTHGLINEFATRTGFTGPSNYVVAGNTSAWIMRKSTYKLVIGNDSIVGGAGEDLLVGDNGFMLMQVAAANGTLAGNKTTVTTYNSIETALKSQDNTMDAALRNHLNLRHPDSGHTGNSDKKAQWLFENGNPFELSVGNDTIRGGGERDLIVGDFATIQSPTLLSPTNDSREVTELTKNFDTSLAAFATRLFLTGGGGKPMHVEAFMTGVAATQKTNAVDWALDGGYNYWWIDTKLTDKRHSQKQAASAYTLYSDTIYGDDGDDLISADVAALKPVLSTTTGTGLATLLVMVPLNEAGFSTTSADNYLYQFGPFARLLPPYDESTTHKHDYIVADDVVYGGNGNDFIFGQRGNDTLYGEAGDDRIGTGDGKDTVSGGTGNNQIGITSGKDKILTTSGGKDQKMTAIDAGGTAKTLVRFTLDRPLLRSLSTDIVEAGASLQNYGVMAVGFRDYNTSAPATTNDKQVTIRNVSINIPTPSQLIAAVRSSEIVVRMVEEDSNVATPFQQLYIYDEQTSTFVPQTIIEDATQLPGRVPPKKQLPSIMFDGERWITVDIETGY